MRVAGYSKLGRRALTKTKSNLVEAVQRNMGVTKPEAMDLVEVLFETVRGTLEKGEAVKLSGFGNFVVRSKNSRRGRNPKTGEEVEISARKVVTFKASRIMLQERVIKPIERPLRDPTALPG
jgi:integration host factor subunit alpha